MRVVREWRKRREGGYRGESGEGGDRAEGI